MRRHIAILLLAAGVLGHGAAHSLRAASLPRELAPLEFLLGDWEGGGGGTPGQSTGGTSFAPGLQDRVVIRSNFAVTPTTSQAPASRHDDLMIIYVDERGVVRADYYDNEGHVIRYSMAAAGPGHVVFTSDPVAAGPQYQLTYQDAPPALVKGTFSIASPGKPGVFTPYLTWDMRRRRASGKR
jgi:hypothetical protein